MQEQRFLLHNMEFLVLKHLEYFQHLKADFQDFLGLCDDTPEQSLQVRPLQ